MSQVPDNCSNNLVNESLASSEHDPISNSAPDQEFNLDDYVFDSDDDENGGFGLSFKMSEDDQLPSSDPANKPPPVKVPRLELVSHSGVPDVDQQFADVQECQEMHDYDLDDDISGMSRDRNVKNGKNSGGKKLYEQMQIVRSNSESQIEVPGNPNCGESNNNKEADIQNLNYSRVLENYMKDPNCWKRLMDFAKSEILDFHNKFEMENICSKQTKMLIENEDQDKFGKQLVTALFKRFTETNISNSLAVNEEVNSSNNAESEHISKKETIESKFSISYLERSSTSTYQLSTPAKEIPNQRIDSDFEESSQNSDSSNENPNFTGKETPEPIPSASVASQRNSLEPNQLSIYERLESVLEKAFARMSLIQDNKKQAREVCKILFNAIFNETEILQGSSSGRKRIRNGPGNASSTIKRFDEAKTLVIYRFFAWMSSNPETRSIESFKTFEENLKTQHKTGLGNFISGHIQERVFVKHASTQRKDLEKTFKKF